MGTTLGRELPNQLGAKQDRGRKAKHVQQDSGGHNTVLRVAVRVETRAKPRQPSLATRVEASTWFAQVTDPAHRHTCTAGAEEERHLIGLQDCNKTVTLRIPQ